MKFSTKLDKILNDGYYNSESKRWSGFFFRTGLYIWGIIFPDIAYLVGKKRIIDINDALLILVFNVILWQIIEVILKLIEKFRYQLEDDLRISIPLFVSSLIATFRNLFRTK